MEPYCIISWAKTVKKAIIPLEDLEYALTREDAVSGHEVVTSRKEEEFEVTFHLREFTFEAGGTPPFLSSPASL